MAITGENSGFFEPEVILPAQFTARCRNVTSGEYRLVVAVLDDAIHCYRTHLGTKDRIGQQLFRESEAWLMSSDKSAFSFLYICDVLGMDPRAVRERLLRMRHPQFDSVLSESA